MISKLNIPKRWKLRLLRHFWREKYFNDLLKRLETNSDVDPTIVEIDKKKYQKMLKGDQSRQIAGRSGDCEFESHWRHARHRRLADFRVV